MTDEAREKREAAFRRREERQRDRDSRNDFLREQHIHGLFHRYGDSITRAFSMFTLP